MRTLQDQFRQLQRRAMLSPKDPANEAAPETAKGWKLLESGGQAKESRLVMAFSTVSVYRSTPTFPFSFRIGLWLIGVAGWLMSRN